MTNTDAASSFLDSHSMGESHDGVSFPQIGDRVVGTVIDQPREVETQYGPRLVINLTPTGLIQNGAPVTDGEPRSLWVKPGAMATALRTALNGSLLGVGDTVGMAYTGDGVARQAGHNPPKQYKALHEPAAPSVDVAAVFGDTPTQAPAVADPFGG